MTRHRTCTLVKYGLRGLSAGESENITRLPETTRSGILVRARAVKNISALLSCGQSETIPSCQKSLVKREGIQSHGVKARAGREERAIVGEP